jgi:hypothetical protein
MATWMVSYFLFPDFHVICNTLFTSLALLPGQPIIHSTFQSTWNIEDGEQTSHGSGFIRMRGF